MKKVNYYDDLRTKRALSKALNLSEENVKFIDTIYGGMSNKTYLYEADGKRYVSHIATKGYDLFLERVCELDALKILGDKDYIQKPVYLSEKVRIFEYLDGVSMNSMEYQKHYEDIAKLFHKLHDENELFSYNYSPLEYLDSMSKLLSLTLDPLFDESVSLLKKYAQLLKSRKLCPCHNDLQPSNLVLCKDGNIRILDFEFAKNNDYLFDIAAFGNLDFNDSLNLMKYYKPDYNEEELLVLKLWRISINCIWYTIALKKKELGYDKKMKMDFNEVGLFFLNHNRDIIDSIKDR